MPVKHAKGVTISLRGGGGLVAVRQCQGIRRGPCRSSLAPGKSFIRGVPGLLTTPAFSVGPQSYPWAITRAHGKEPLTRRKGWPRPR
jgi:hypothetical protein